MNSNMVFSINEGVIKFLQVSGMQKKSVTAVDLIDIKNMNDVQISDSIAEFVKLHKIKFTESRVTILIPRSRAILRYMVFPSHKEEEIRSMIDLQVGGSIPYLREEVEIDFQVMNTTADGYAKVAVVIIPQELAMRYWKIFSNAKVPVETVSISSIGLWLFYKQQPNLSDNLTAVFDLDVDRSEICLCYKTHWLNSREISIGFEQMQKEGYIEILNQWDLTLNNAKQDKLSLAVELVYLVSTTNRAYALEVEMAKLQNNLTVKEISLTQTLSMAHNVHWPKLMTDVGISVASLAGVAFSSHTPPIDLTPRVVKQAKIQSLYQRQLVILGVWVITALISLGIALGIGFVRKHIQLARLESKLRDTKSDAFKVDKQLQKVYDIEGMIKDRLIFSDLAREIGHLLPAQVYLVSVTLSDENTLSLQGVSSNSVEINQFQKDMVGSKSFSNVSLDYVNKRITQQGEVDYFKITCALNIGKGQK